MLGVAGFVLAHARPATDAEFRAEVIGAGHQAIRDVVREEIRTAFASLEETQYEDIGGGKYQLGGWVDLISEEGHISRQHFSCTLYQNENGEWIAEDVAVTPQ